jgi:hypothetical protein
METLENNTPIIPQEEVVVKTNRKAFGAVEPQLTSLEASIQSRRNDLSEAALCAMFELTHEQLSEIIAKLPPPDDCNC